MGYQLIFKRFELKYMLTKEQKEIILNEISPYMAIDKYGRTTIRNIYFDTDDYRLIRASIEKPIYKEKLRVRSYDLATPDSTVFVEIKKKYKKVVYKRRVSMSEATAMNWLCNDVPLEETKKNQISEEIEYFRNYYKNLKPSVFLTYEREAFYSKDNSDFRITFDENIMYRQSDMSLTSPPYGTSILEGGKILMEIKCSGGIPMWMVKILSREHIYKTSFSKYGTAYRDIVTNNIKKNSAVSNENIIATK